MKCPKCESENLSRYSGGIDCNNCLYMGRPIDFGAKCSCENSHPLPVWYCELHGEVVVPMD